MNKCIKMLRTYRKVLKNNKEEINKVIPNMYSESFYTIDFNYLLNKNIDKLIIDIDNTILPTDDIKVPNELITKIEELKKDFSICLVSNNYKRRVEPVANILDVRYLDKAKKPLPECFKKSMDILNETNVNKVAMIGDQMLTDIVGANEYNVYSVLVKPISKRHNIGTLINRYLQNKIEKHLLKENIFDKDKYYKKF